MMTYKNRCELEKAQCESGNKFQYAHHGECEGKKNNASTLYIVASLASDCHHK